MLKNKYSTVLGNSKKLIPYYVDLLIILILYKVIVNITNGNWYGDFWEHSAVIQALMTTLISSSHPFFALEADHAFTSPYHWIIAVIGKYFNLDSINSLAIFSIFNICLLFIGLKVYIKSFVKNNYKYTYFYAVIFILFLWGSRPWAFSGFLYFDLISDVLPYPSTFAIALSLIGLGIGFDLFRHPSLVKQLSLILITSVVLLSHPLTFIFLASGLLCQTVVSNKIITTFANRLLVLVIACIIASFWPYYSIFELLKGAGDVYHLPNKSMYSDVLVKIWPILILSPLLWFSIKSKETVTILIHILFLLFIYFYGWLSAKYSYGRDITFIIILTQILIANQIANFEIKFSNIYPRIMCFYRITIGIIIICLASTWLYPTFTRSLTVINNFVLDRNISNQNTYKNLTFLPLFIKKDSVVLSDLSTSWKIPSLGGKVIGALHVQAFISDDKSRRDALIEFFSNDVLPSKRQLIIQKYKPDYLLIDKLAFKDWQIILNELDTFSIKIKIYENDQYLLYRFETDDN